MASSKPLKDDNPFAAVEDGYGTERIPLVDEERQGLQNGKISPRHQKTCWTMMKDASKNRIFLWSILILVLVGWFATVIAWKFPRVSESFDSQPKNLIFMISDGYGPAEASMVRAYYNIVLKGRSINDIGAYLPLPLDNLQIGAARTKSSNSLVTDSAAGATAYTCAKKAKNGYVGVDDNEKPCGTLMEAAKAAGMKTGVVVTSRVTHATPASFTTHVLDRDNEQLIAKQLVGSKADVIMGGGLCYFQPSTVSKSCRTDSFDGVANFTQQGYHVLLNRTAFDQIHGERKDLPLVAFFASKHMAYEIDRVDSIQPSLAEMVQKAIDALHDATKDSQLGFMLLIEGSRIDMAGHDNDPATLVQDTLAYQDAVQVALNYTSKYKNTLLVSTSDHETGGLTLGVQLNYTQYPQYEWDPRPLSLQKNSTEVLATYLVQQNQLGVNITDLLISVVLPNWLGLTHFTEEEVMNVVQGMTMASQFGSNFYIMKPLNILVSRTAGLGWTTPGHTGVDVNLYAYGSGANDLLGNLENIQVGEYIEKVFGFDLDAISKKIQNVPIS